jgi:hypothetical protein
MGEETTPNQNPQYNLGSRHTPHKNILKQLKTKKDDKELCNQQW